MGDPPLPISFAFCGKRGLFILTGSAGGFMKRSPKGRRTAPPFWPDRFGCAGQSRKEIAHITAIQRFSAILSRPSGLVDSVTRGQSRKEVAQGAAIQKLATILRHPSGLVDPVARGSPERRLLNQRLATNRENSTLAGWSGGSYIRRPSGESIELFA
ncbi:hypothetical protein CLOSTMETH_03387 [[Clostridium] methylpentosum DSM 5476]|uniref:Uncharacterized protein n=1 Tax=[Clostridium] methylpentosum DSM 5476 TaxID=537013 RepID=C0EHP2_9FIRM|nr:hypothetical protein CLOSTMETH_03387 [[Clostridium] methylpentosum DSM 5476]